MSKIGKYDIVQELGRGGMGVVYKGHDALMERDVAIKVMADLMLTVPEIRERFFREARTAGKLSHENITVVFDVGEEEGRPFIVMEYLTGSDLAEMLEKREPIPFLQKLDFAIQICRGLSYSHAHDIVHRDIKPQNIRIVGNGRVKIMDFGIARSVTSTMTTTGAVIGTPYYMSPEQIQGRHVDKRSDIFSFGVLFYELLSGRKPFTGDVPTAVMFKIVYDAPPPLDDEQIDHRSGLRDIVLKTLAKDPDQRFQDLAEVADALENIVSDLRVAERKKMEQFRARLGKMISESRTLLKGNKFRRARDIVEEAARMDPANTEVARLRSEITAAEEREARKVFIQERLAGARRAFQGKELQKSLSLLQEILKVEPEHAEALKLSREVSDAINFADTGDLRYAVTRRPGEPGPLEPPPQPKAPAPPEKPAPQTRKPAPPPPAKEEREQRRAMEEREPRQAKEEREPRLATMVPRPKSRIYVVAAAIAALVVAGVLYRTLLYTPSVPQGYVALNVVPWGEVAKIVREDGKEMPLAAKTFTPCRLTLPEGSYIIEVTNPMFGKPLVDTVRVRTDEIQRITKKFAGFDGRTALVKFQ